MLKFRRRCDSIQLWMFLLLVEGDQTDVRFCLKWGLFHITDPLVSQGPGSVQIHYRTSGSGDWCLGTEPV